MSRPRKHPTKTGHTDINNHTAKHQQNHKLISAKTKPKQSAKNHHKTKPLLLTTPHRFKPYPHQEISQNHYKTIKINTRFSDFWFNPHGQDIKTVLHYPAKTDQNEPHNLIKPNNTHGQQFTWPTRTQITSEQIQNHVTKPSSNP